MFHRWYSMEWLPMSQWAYVIFYIKGGLFVKLPEWHDSYGIVLMEFPKWFSVNVILWISVDDTPSDIIVRYAISHCMTHHGMLLNVNGAGRCME